MAWSPDYKKNRFFVVNRMKIKDYQNYDSIREYYAVLNGQNANKSLSPRAPTFSGSANPNVILQNIKRGDSAPSQPAGPAPAADSVAVRELKVPVGFSAVLSGKVQFTETFKRAFSASYVIPGQ